MPDLEPPLEKSGYGPGICYSAHIFSSVRLVLRYQINLETVVVHVDCSIRVYLSIFTYPQVLYY